MKTEQLSIEENKFFFEKLLEIRALSNSSFSLSIIGCIIFQQDCYPIELSIDEQTYTQLNEVVKFQQNCRYRLSLYSRWDPFRQQHFITITKIMGEKRESNYLRCSPEFHDILYKLQGIQNIQQIVSINEIKIPENVPQETKDVPVNNNISKVKRNGTSHIMVSKSLQILMQAGVLAIFFFIHSVNASDGLHYFNSSSVSGEEIISTAERVSVDYELEEYQPENPKTDVVGDNKASTREKKNDFVYLEMEKRFEYCVPEGYVALTFDDGPSKYTRDIVDILVEQGVGATFFFLGKNSAMYPENVKYAVSNGMSVGNHSWSHSNLTSLLPVDKIKEIVETNTLLSSLTEVPITLFRPPYGLLDDILLEEIANQQMKVMMWNRDPKDWKLNGKDNMIQYFLESEPSGGVYVLHENSLMVQSLPDIIEILKQSNLEFAVLK
ncbi:polysaccharide deacetylase family protein [Candidatus Contubernalis alkaliaceticus]|uniref:polysaccharide deacetylase family protein n=1 Tax=Candidatus Contubernalis alkaliaceticus TaxID=338645 RepID=UPI001F4C3D5A|nr:polysaccharide deacetylase family protein [Candidatus Contubernalis alkalaceticus]UNC92450.1 polysaccharide deacetylase family protein [Candidatus Contubernalis alkalaceticus]